MSAAVLYMSMSLDGFIAGPNEGPDNGLGDGGHRLHEWAMTGGGDVDLEAIRRSGGVNGKVVDEFMSTGAAGAATTTTASQSSSTAAESPASTSASGRLSPT
jgi:hypothetical protein